MHNNKIVMIGGMGSHKVEVTAEVKVKWPRIRLHYMQNVTKHS